MFKRGVETILAVGMMGSGILYLILWVLDYPQLAVFSYLTVGLAVITLLVAMSGGTK